MKCSVICFAAGTSKKMECVTSERKSIRIGQQGFPRKFGSEAARKLSKPLHLCT